MPDILDYAVTDQNCAQNQDTGMSRQIPMAGKDDVTWSQVKNSSQMQPIKVKELCHEIIKTQTEGTVTKLSTA